MTTPNRQQGGLSDEQIELLRKLPQHDLRLQPRDRSIAERLTTGSAKRPPLPGLTFMDEAHTVHRTQAADLLLATIDAAVAAERERVLAEVDERVEELAINDATISVFFDGGKAVIGTHETQGPYREEGSGRTFSAALDACTTPHHRLSNPHGETDQ